MVKIEDLCNPEKFEELGVISLGRLRDSLNHLIDNCTLNKRDPYKVPVMVKDSSAGLDYKLFTTSLCFGKRLFATLEFFGNESDVIDYFEGKDEQPESGGEFWKSRGPSDWDCSGFVVSKEAGERLLAMVKEVTGLEKPKSWLDWRHYEPNWIQFKFSSKEFDVVKLDKLSRALNGVLTMEILQECLLEKQ